MIFLPHILQKWDKKNRNSRAQFLFNLFVVVCSREKEYVSLSIGNCPSTDVILGDTSTWQYPLQIELLVCILCKLEVKWPDKMEMNYNR